MRIGGIRLQKSGMIDRGNWMSEVMEAPSNEVKKRLNWTELSIVEWPPICYHGLPSDGSTGLDGYHGLQLGTHLLRQPHCLPPLLASPHYDALHRLHWGPSTSPRYSPSSTSSVCSETRSWFDALWGAECARSRCDDGESGIGWNEILSRAPVSGTVCTSGVFSSARTRCLQHPHQHQHISRRSHQLINKPYSNL